MISLSLLLVSCLLRGWCGVGRQREREREAERFPEREV